VRGCDPSPTVGRLPGEAGALRQANLILTVEKVVERRVGRVAIETPAPLV
jgi:hypothetical protein